MNRQSLERRLDVLERGTPDGITLYVIDTGDGYVEWQGQRVPLDEYQRQFPDAVVVDIGGTLDGDET